jgi:DnaK suppressor protein
MMATKRTSSTPGKDNKKTAPKKTAVAPKKVVAAKTVVKKETPKAPAKALAKAPAKKKEAPKAVPAKAPAAKTPAKKEVAKIVPAAKTAPVKPVPVTKGKAPVVSLRMPVKKAGKGKGALAGGISPYQSKKGENYMNKAQKAHFRSLLLAWKSELMEEVDRTVSHMKDEAANFPDPADRATQEEEFSLELRARDRERKLIKKIDSTLELIEQDDYGYCSDCGIEIGVHRLEVRPTATQCIDCKTLAEIKEKQLGA